VGIVRSVNGHTVLDQKKGMAFMPGKRLGIGLLIVTLFTLAVLGPADSAWAQADTVTVDIPPQELSSALKTFTDQTNLQVLYASELARGLGTKGVAGTFTPQEALRQLLDGTGLQVTFTDAKTITLQKASPPTPMSQTQPAGPVEPPTTKQKPVKVPEISITAAVTATRTERELDSISKSISVITREQIETRNAINVLESLEEVPGVSYSRAGGLGGQVVMRGLNSNNLSTVLFIDGDRFRGRNTFEYSFLDQNQIERIEVIRGPVSALYGPDGLAGIINVITRRAKGDPDGPFRLVPRLRALNYNSVNNLRGTRAEVEGLGRGIDMLAGLSWRQADDYQSPLGKILNTAFDSFQTDLRLGYTVTPGHRFEIIAKYAEIESGRAGGIGGIPGPPLVRLREDPLRERFAKLSYTGRSESLGLDRIEASVYGRQIYSHLGIDNRTQANRLIHSDNFVEGPLVLGGKAFVTKPWGGHNLLTVGADFFRENRDGTATASQTTTFNSAGVITGTSVVPRAQNVPNVVQTDVGVFLHNDWDPSQAWTVSVGGRVDYIRTVSETSPLPAPQLQEAYERNHKNTETPLTGGLGLIYRPWEVLHFTANVGKAFRAPATFESFGSSRQGAGFLVPNPELKSEEGVTYEVGTRLRFSRVHANLTAFWSEYTNLILSRPVTFLGLPSTQRQNAGEARIQGAEFDATWSLSNNWQTFMNAAYLYATDTSTDRPLPYIPPLNGLVGIRYTWDKGFYVEGVNKWSIQKDRIDTQQERKTAGYAIFNLHAGADLWKLSKRLPELRLTVGVDNVLNQAYRQPTTVEDVRFGASNTNPLLEPGRAVSIALTSRF
jgi:hemoglobin/transferrin/lactoferrin receptor protein